MSFPCPLRSAAVLLPPHLSTAPSCGSLLCRTPVHCTLLPYYDPASPRRHPRPVPWRHATRSCHGPTHWNMHWDHARPWRPRIVRLGAWTPSWRHARTLHTRSKARVRAGGCWRRARARVNFSMWETHRHGTHARKRARVHSEYAQLGGARGHALIPNPDPLNPAGTLRATRRRSEGHLLRFFGPCLGLHATRLFRIQSLGSRRTKELLPSSSWEPCPRLRAAHRGSRPVSNKGQPNTSFGRVS